MGMSASQMRYCMLAGKKSDVEYQGQQINQQRTTLATESSQYNTQLLNLIVPTPPSSDSYTKTTYTFSSNGQSRTVVGTQYKSTNYYLDANGNIQPGNAPANSGLKQFYAGSYVVNYTTNETTSQGKSSGSAIFSRTDTDTNNDGVSDITKYKTANGTVLTKVITNQTDPNYDATDISNINLINKDCGRTDTDYYKYTSGGVTKYVPFNNELEDKANTTNTVPVYYVDNDSTVTRSANMYGATVEWNDSGRMTNITDSDGNEYNLSVTSTNDENAYQDAFNEYEYQKNLYQQQMDNINSKICIIQSEDKKLELKLQDLDTQQKALSTEMESVKKVIDKNIDSSFKSFA